MKISRRISIILALVLVLFVFSGCNETAGPSDEGGPKPTADTNTPTEPSDNGSSSDPSTENGYTLPLSKGDITLTCWGFPLPEWKIDDLDNNDFTNWLEEQTGVNIEWVMGPATDRETKLSLLLSSGEYPEVIFNPGFSPSQQQIYGQQGLILELNDFIDKYGIETKRMYAEIPEIKAAVERDGGKIYVMPSFFDSPHDYSYSRMWVYQPWLDNLNLDMPETTEEFYDMLVAFRDNDPNGNGKKDEIPYVGAEQVWFSEITPFFMNSFIYYDNRTQMNLVDGKVIPVFAQEEYKEGLKYLNRLYENELIMPQTFSHNEQALKQLLSNDEMIVGCFTAHAPFLYCDEEIYSDLSPVPPLKGPNGIQYTAFYYVTQTDGTVITDKCKNPEIAFKFLDFLYSFEASMRKSQGPKGEAWELNDDDSIKNDYGITPTFFTLRSSENTPPNTKWALMGNGYQPPEYNGIYVMDMSPEAVAAREQAGEQKVNGYVQIQLAAMNVYNKYFPPAELRMPQVLIFTEDESYTLADKELMVKNKVAEMRTQFITGNANFDADWDNYIKELESLGMDEVVAIYQAAYDRR